jgi:hypothetical protein
MENPKEMKKVDETGQLIHTTINGVVRLDGIPVLCITLRDNKYYFRFRDPDRTRSRLRKTRDVEIPADVFLQYIQGKVNGNKLAANSAME